MKYLGLIILLMSGDLWAFDYNTSCKEVASKDSIDIEISGDFPYELVAEASLYLGDYHIPFENKTTSYITGVDMDTKESFDGFIVYLHKAYSNESYMQIERRAAGTVARLKLKDREPIKMDCTK